MNEPLESISSDLGFRGDTLAEGIHTASAFFFSWHIDSLAITTFDFFFYNLCCFICLGLVVSVCLGGAFLGSLFSGGAADGLGRRRAFQLCALPMILGAFVR